jgi:class 3 adenylate cyclase
MEGPMPENERDRLKALEAYDVIGTPPEVDFDEIAEMAGQICGCPISVINLIAEKWEWFKGKYGLPEEMNCEPRGSICSTTICSNDLLIVPDLTKDKRFAHREMVAGEPHFRFYAGAPLINSEGYALGTLCVLDYEPRAVDAQQVKGLSSLARQAVAQLELRRKIAELREIHVMLSAEKLQAETLLHNILPQSIAEELRASGKVQPRYYASVTILFTDFQGFTQMTERLEPRALIEELHEHFSRFDDIAGRYGLEKLKTIGDAYMCVAGLPRQTNKHASDACNAALNIRDYMARTNKDRSKLGLPRWNIRIGIHTGGVIAGVVGKKKFTYDVWGDAVNTASLMEAHAEPGQILLSDSTFAHLHGEFETVFRDQINTPKKGSLRCYVLSHRKGEGMRGKSQPE